MSASTAWLIIKVVFGLLPSIIAAVREESVRQAGRDQVVDAVLERFKNVRTQAQQNRDNARDDIDAGVRNERYRRD